MLKNIAFTLFMGLIIAPVLMLVHYNYTLRKSVYELIQDKKFSPFPYSDEPEKESVRIQSDYKSDSLEIELNTILFIESSDNYLNVHYLKDEEIHHRFIRKTLSALEKSAIHPALIRCHRSYIINKNNVQSVKSNAGEYSLLIKYVRREIPVSRNYRNVVLTSIRV